MRTTDKEREAMDRMQRICGGRIVTPDGVLEGGTVVIEGGKIAEVSGRCDILGPGDVYAGGCWILPGMIDPHSDAIEHEMQPRPNSRFPLEWSFLKLERKLAAQGITTIYHSFSMVDGDTPNASRRNASVAEYVHKVRELSRTNRLIRHKVHLRFEITNTGGVPLVEQFIRNGTIDLLSFMDHTPGQGQYRDQELHKRYVMQRQNLSEQEVLRRFEESRRRPKVPPDTLQRLADLAREHGIPLASHDDDSCEKLEIVSGWRAAISEFPVDMETAACAKRRGMAVVMGAPNVMLGRSHSNNLSAREAIRAGVVDILCSDYYPPAMLQSVFLLHREGLPLHLAVRMVTKNTASVLGLSGEFGSIEPGKAADLIMVGMHGDRPVVERVWVGGRTVCLMAYKETAAVPSGSMALQNLP